MFPCVERGVAGAGLTGPATPLWMRLSLAIAASVALHAVLVFGLHPAGAPRKSQLDFMMMARLSPLPASEPLTASAGDRHGPVPAQPVSGSAADAAPPAPPAPQETRPATTPGNTGVPATTPKPGWLEAPLPAPRYYLASELDRKPEPMQPVEPESPADAGSTEGSVVLRVLIDERGSVDGVEVVRARPQGVFEKSAIAAFNRTRFSPAMLYGVPVKSQLLVEVQFRNPKPVVSGRGY